MKIFCIGRNYSQHAKELGNEVPEAPVVFMKPPTALLKGNRDFYYPDFSKNIHFEVELVLKISKNGKNIQEKFAHKYYNQISLGIDFTARDLQNDLKQRGLPWEIAKGFDNSAVIGKFIDLSTLLDKEEIIFSLIKNQTTVQQGNSSFMLFSFDKIVSYISKYFMLQQGDLIYTGTPAGVGEVKIGDSFQGFIANEELFSCQIK